MSQNNLPVPSIILDDTCTQQFHITDAKTSHVHISEICSKEPFKQCMTLCHTNLFWNIEHCFKCKGKGAPKNVTKVLRIIWITIGIL